MNDSISSAAMSVDSNGLFGTLDAELEQAVSLFSKQHNGVTGSAFLFSSPGALISTYL